MQHSKRSHHPIRPTRLTRLTSALVVAGLLLAALPAGAAEAKKVNVNTASAAQLTLLPRVGPSVAQRIVDFRKQNGAFKSVDDLMLVRGIGEKTFALIKPYVATSGETTLTDKVRAKPEGTKAKPESKAKAVEVSR